MTWFSRSAAPMLAVSRPVESRAHSTASPRLPRSCYILGELVWKDREGEALVLIPCGEKLGGIPYKAAPRRRRGYLRVRPGHAQGATYGRGASAGTGARARRPARAAPRVGERGSRHVRQGAAAGGRHRRAPVSAAACEHRGCARSRAVAPEWAPRPLERRRSVTPPMAATHRARPVSRVRPDLRPCVAPPASVSRHRLASCPRLVG